MLGVRRWRELVADRKKNERTLFDRPKPKVACSANGIRRIFCDKYSKMEKRANDKVVRSPRGNGGG